MQRFALVLVLGISAVLSAGTLPPVEKLEACYQALVEADGSLKQLEYTVGGAERGEIYFLHWNRAQAYSGETLTFHLSFARGAYKMSLPGFTREGKMIQDRLVRFSIEGVGAPLFVLRRAYRKNVVAYYYVQPLTEADRNLPAYLNLKIEEAKIDSDYSAEAGLTFEKAYLDWLVERDEARLAKGPADAFLYFANMDDPLWRAQYFYDPTPYRYKSARHLAWEKTELDRVQAHNAALERLVFDRAKAAVDYCKTQLK